MPHDSEDGAHSRASERSNVFLAAALCTATSSFPVRIRNISKGGALLDGTNLPGEGSRISLRRAHLSAEGDVAWQADDLRGIRFRSEIDVREWVGLKGHAGQQRVDQTIAAIRRAEPMPDPAPALESIDSIAAALEQICERLASSPGLSDEVADEILHLDSIAIALRRVQQQ
jgi:hypothetical protein